LLDSLLQETMASVRTILISAALITIATQVSADTVFSRDWFSDVGDTLSGAFSDAWSSVSSKETWNTVATALEGAGQDALAWSKEAWVNTGEGIECLKNAGSNADKMIECRKELYTASGASALSFNFFVGASIVALLIAKAV